METKKKGEWIEESSSKYSRRQALDLLAAGGLGLMLGSIPGQALCQSQDEEEVRIGYLPIADATALLVAHALGYFEQEGLPKVNLTKVNDWETLVRGFAEGHFNLAHMLIPIPVWLRYNDKIPVKIVAWAHVNGSAIVVGKNTGIEDFGHMAGRRIAIPHSYSMHNILLQEGLRKAGIRPVMQESGPVAKDTCGLMVVPPPMMVKFLGSERIDGFTVAEPFNAMGELSAGGKIMRFSGDMWKDHPCCVIVMHEKETTDKPQWCQKVVNAIVRAETYAAEHKDEVAKLLSVDGKGYFSASSQVVLHALTHFDEKAYANPKAIRNQKKWNNNRIDFHPFPYPSATRLIVEMMGRTLVEKETTFLKQISSDFVAKDLVNTDFVRKAMETFPQTHPLSYNSFDREELLDV